MIRYTEKPNQYRIFGQTETDHGIQQTENTKKLMGKTDNIRYFGIHYFTMAMLCNALKLVL